MQHRRTVGLFAGVLCALFAITACGALAQAPEYTEAERAALDYLGQQLTEPAAHLMRTGEGVDKSVYDMGGNYYLATSSLASGVGVLKEKYAPYQNSEGALDKEGDWSLPEDMRFWESYELKDANVLPAPARRDADGNYVYRPEGAEAIKGELLKGRAVGISFLADQSRPVQTPEEMRASMEKNLAGNISVSAAEKAAYIDARVGATDLGSLSKAELEDLVRLRCRLNGMDEDLYDMDALEPDELIRIFRSDYFSKPYDELVKLEEEAAEQVPYMSFVGGDPVTYAQYTYEAKAGNHAVCVVGWDDTFPASSFREGYQPAGGRRMDRKEQLGDRLGQRRLLLPLLLRHDPRRRPEL